MWKGTEGVALVYWWCTIPVDLEMDRISPRHYTYGKTTAQRGWETWQISHSKSPTKQELQLRCLKLLSCSLGSGVWSMDEDSVASLQLGISQLLHDLGHCMLSGIGSHWVTWQGQKEYAGRIEKIFQLKVTSFLHVSGKQEKENSLKIILFWIYISQNLFIQQIFIDFLLWAKFCSRSQEHKVPAHRKLTFKWKSQKLTS